MFCSKAENFLLNCVPWKVSLVLPLIFSVSIKRLLTQVDRNNSFSSGPQLYELEKFSMCNAVKTAGISELHPVDCYCEMA